MRSWVFFNGLFHKTLWCSLAVSIIAKWVVNVMIVPLTSPQLVELKGQTFHFPAGAFAITHTEHWYDGWPDYTEGLVGKISLSLSSLIEKFVSYGNVELPVYLGIWLLIAWCMSYGTIGNNKAGLAPIYIGLGLGIAGTLSNHVEAALFGHATDFLYFSFSESSKSYVVGNLADVMVICGFMLVIITTLLRRSP